MNKLFKKKGVLNRIISGMLIAVLVSCTLFTGVRAEGLNTTGTYNFTRLFANNTQGSDKFEWNDEWFAHSSYENNSHLVTISAQAAIASRSRFGKEAEQYEQDSSNTSENISNLLSSIGFSNVSSNEWTKHEMQENSIGVTLGEKTINADGKSYTLIAICPRSSGYRQEWAGNMNVGTGDIHEGFKLARDEILRFVKKYIADNNINGDLKVWIAGHSRGAAVANMLGGFFAGGGIEYFGNSVSITPQDVYCYTFETPKTVKSSLGNNTALSVSAARGGVYQYDTTGNAYKYTKGGTIDADSDVYSGIKNYAFSYDFITYLPLEKWGFTYYGKVYDYSGALEKNMEKNLLALDKGAYDTYLEGNPNDFHEKTFDISSLSVVDEPGGLSGKEGLAKFLGDRVSKGFSIVASNGKYSSEGYQEALCSTLAAFSMLAPVLKERGDILSSLIQPVAFGYLAYASDELIKAGKASNEDEGAALAILELIEYAIEEDRDLATYNVDNFVVDFATFVTENKDSEAVKQVKDALTKVVPKEYEEIAKGVLGMFYPNAPEDLSNIPIGDIAVAFIEACINGADPASKAYKEDIYRTGEGVRKNALYTLVNAMQYLGNEDATKVIEAINSGDGKFTGFVAAILNIMKKDIDPATGEKRGNYATLAEASDGELKKGFEKIGKDAIDTMTSKNLYTQEYRDNVARHIAVITEHVTQLRTVAVSVLFNNGEEFSTKENIKSASTLYGNINRMIIPHYTELCIAWGKAMPDEKSDNVISVDTDNNIALVKDKVLGQNVYVPIDRILEGMLYRMYDPTRGEHLYTKDLSEVIYLQGIGWNYEKDSDSMVVDASGEHAIPVYRLYNPNGGGFHFYTENALEAKYLSETGWSYEGISHYVYDKDTDEGIEQYRMYNPYSPAAEHLWTIDVGEVFYLESIGWKYEGACWRIEN